ncbi:MAG: phosphatidate cytidylyltransferase [Xanthobacteraceae bacterium]
MADDRAVAAPGSDRGARNLLTRVAAAVVLAPATVAIAYAGGWWWASLVTVAAIGLYVEWLMVVGAMQRPWAAAVGAAALALAGLAVAANRIGAAAALIAIGVVGAAASSSSRRSWAGSGLLYAGMALVAAVLVRHDPQTGFVALIFVLLVVWVTDIGGYFAGRSIGGPKLWPRVSPKKTWAGAVGGLAASLLIAVAVAVLGFGALTTLLLLAAALSVVSQLGDLFESAVKRKFGVKDSSHIIPGHGGLLDRLDGFVAAIVIAALIGFMRGGADGVGRGLLFW